MRLKGKVAVITGGARGIGAAFAESFAREGASVCIADIDADAAGERAHAIGGTAFAAKLDVTKTDSINALVADMGKKAGGIDILVNNAAVFNLAPITEVTEKQFDAVYDVNVKGLFFTLQAVAKSMIARGKGGKIINVASQAGRRGEPLVAAYCSSKSAVISITQSAGLALIKDKINVNGISPGVVDTPMWDEVDAMFAKYENLPRGEKKRQVGIGVPYGRMGKPEDLVGCAIFLASPESDYVVAQTFNVDGGQWMS